MGGEVNNGVQLGPVDLLLNPVRRRPNPMRTLWELALTIVSTTDMETSDWVLTVRSNPDGEIVAASRYATRRAADQARADLVAVAEASGDLAEVDWAALLA